MNRSCRLSLLVLVCWLAFPASALANGIDLPLALGIGILAVLPLLLFNATVEAPIVAWLVGIRLSELWWPWFKANVWSLVAGVGAFGLNDALKGWLVPDELGARIRVYPFFLVFAVAVYYAITAAVEWAYARRLFAQAGLDLAAGKALKVVLLANAASYLMLGPLFVYHEFPRSEIAEFSPDSRWARRPGLTVLALGAKGHLEASSMDGQTWRVVVPHEVRDYVVSADLSQVLYRGVGDRMYWFQQGTNVTIPELGFRCRAPEMDFSPGGRYAAFIGRDSSGLVLSVFDLISSELRRVPHLATGYDNQLTWSSRVDAFYLRASTNYWEIMLGDEISQSRHSKAPTDISGHYGRVGSTRSREGFFYTHHVAGPRKLRVIESWASAGRLVVSGEEERLTVRDPAGRFSVGQAVFLACGEEVLLELGGRVHLLDVAGRRLGPAMSGHSFIVLDPLFSKGADF